MRKILLFYLCFISACHKDPMSSPSASNLSPLLPAPMGSETKNEILLKELEVLEKILEGSIPQKLNEEVKTSLMNGNVNKIFAGKKDDKYFIANVYLLMPEMIIKKDSFTNLEKNWLYGKYFFLKRRFIEASKYFYLCLDEDKNFMNARNWLARSLFFLGNPSEANKILVSIVENASASDEEKQDARYLIGAMIFENDERDENKTKIAVKYWQDFLHFDHHENSKLKEEVIAGLKELTSPKIVENLLPHDSYSEAKNECLRHFNDKEILLAHESCQKILANGFDKEVALTLARAKINLGKNDEAMNIFSDLVKKYPKFHEGWHYMGMAFVMKSDFINAIECWQTVVQLNYNYAKKYNLFLRIEKAKEMLNINRS